MFKNVKFSGYLILRVVVLLVLALVLSRSVSAEEANEGTVESLSAETEALIESGMEAIKDGQWDQAIKSLTEVQAEAPKSYKILYNLGIANAEAGERDVIAIAWFNAYLAAVPDALEREQVLEQLENLKIKVNASIVKMLRMADVEAAKITDEQMKFETYRAIAMAEIYVGEMSEAKRYAELITDENSSSSIYLEISRTQARDGDITGARETVDMIVVDDQKSEAYSEIARLQIESGDLEGAREIAALMIDDYNKSRVYYDIVRVQADKGDVQSAMDTTALITDDEFSSYAYDNVIAAQAKAGDISGAARTLLMVEDPSLEAYRNIAEAQIKAGDTAGAIETIGLVEIDQNRARVYSGLISSRIEDEDISGVQEMLALVTEESINDDFVRFELYEEIARARAEAGDIDGAKSTLSMVTDENFKIGAYLTILHKQLDGDDISGAIETSSLIGEDEYKLTVYRDIAIAQAQAGDIAGAKKSAVQMMALGSKMYEGIEESDTSEEGFSPPTEADDQKSEVYLEIVKHQALAGDFIGALYSANNITTDDKKSILYEGVAVLQAKSGDISGAMQTAVLIPGDDRKSVAYAEISKLQAKSGDTEVALETAALITDGESKSWPYREIALYQAKAGDIAGSNKTAALITDEAFRTWVSGDIEKVVAGDTTVFDTTSVLLGDADSELPSIALGPQTGEDDSREGQYDRDQEIDSWSGFAVYSGSVPWLGDLQGLLNGLTDMEPGEKADAIIETCQYMSQDFNELQRNEEHWQELRAESSQ